MLQVGPKEWCAILDAYVESHELVRIAGRLVYGKSSLTIAEAGHIRANLEHIHTVVQQSIWAQKLQAGGGFQNAVEGQRPSPEEALQTLLDATPGIVLQPQGPDEYGPYGESDLFFGWGKPCDDRACGLHHPASASQDGLRKHLQMLMSGMRMPAPMLAHLRTLVEAADTTFQLIPTGIIVRKTASTLN